MVSGLQRGRHNQRYAGPAEGKDGLVLVVLPYNYDAFYSRHAGFSNLVNDPHYQDEDERRLI